MRFSRKSELLHEVIYIGLYAWALRTRMTLGFHLIKGRSPSLIYFLKGARLKLTTKRCASFNHPLQAVQEQNLIAP